MLLSIFVGEGRAQTGLLDGHQLRWHAVYGLYRAADDGATVVWPPGTYGLGRDGTRNYAFVLSRRETSHDRRARTNLTIDATGVTIIVTDPTIGLFDLTECAGITIKNLTVDYAPLPWNQSVITAVDTVNGTFNVTLDPNYLGFEHSAFGAPNFAKGVLFDPVTRRVKKGTNRTTMFIDRALSLGGRDYQLRVPADSSLRLYLSYFAVGDLFLQATQGSNMFNIGACERTAANAAPVTLNGITVHAASGQWIALNATPTFDATGQARLINCTLGLSANPGTRLVACTSGGVIVSAGRKGPFIDNCRVEYCMDDALNMNVHGRLFKYYLGGGTRFAEFSFGPLWFPNDVLQIFDPITGQVRYATIQNVTYPGNPFVSVQVEFTADVPGMVGNGSDADTSTHAYDTNIANPGYEVRNSQFGKNRGTGAILTWEGRFINNVVDGPQRHGVAVSNLYTYSAAGPVPRNVTVRNNVFKNCGYVDPAPPFQAIAGSAILVMGQKVPGVKTPADYQSVEYVVLEGNTVENWVSHGAHVQAAKNSIILPWNGTNPHENMFLGAVDAIDRAVYIGVPAASLVVDGIDARGAAGLGYAVTLEFGVDHNVTVTNVRVTPPTLPVEDLR